MMTVVDTTRFEVPSKMVLPVSLTVGSLFSGIGGLELGLERAGMTVRWQVEFDEWCQKVLTKHWPEVPKYGDVRELQASSLEAVDVICGGFPCQPVSLAGKREAQADPRWLWPHFARLVDGVRPKYVVVENVPGLRSAGGADVVADLASLGYDCEWGEFSAAGVGARISVTGFSSLPTPTADPVSASATPSQEMADRYRRKGKSGSFVEAIADRMYPTPSANEPGFDPNTRKPVDKDGNPPTHWNQRWYDPVTGRHMQKGLPQIVQMWPTPNARDHKDTGANVDWEKVANKSKLAGVVQMEEQEMWPTPTASDGMGGPGSSGREGGPNLRTAAQDWTTPTVRDSGTYKKVKRGEGSLAKGNQIIEPLVVQAWHSENSGKPTRPTGLNPAWVEWLMGFPPGWTDLED